MNARKKEIQPPATEIPEALRKTELIGLTEDGRMVLWSTGTVRPINHFEASSGDRQCIQSGHYVIDWHGHAITVHICGLLKGGCRLQFMCGAVQGIVMPTKKVEPLLLGVVVPDPIIQAQIMAKFDRIFENLNERDRSPGRQRGRIE
jgi:hypothetical protein